MIDERSFSPGQRWTSDTESDLGLGLVSSLSGRMVTVVFPASGEQRTYAINNAPLSRLSLNVGETAQSHEGWELKIARVLEEERLLIYDGVRSDTGERMRLAETQLNNFTQIADAKSRLLSGQIDSNKWFNIRANTHNRIDQVQSRETYGLCGARISLIPHQLFIAQTLSERFAPRALLADEVGLGKTIEACLVLHKQLLTGRTQRALIIVPEPLLHQWLVELLRRFNLRFKLFDEARCTSAQESDAGVNPFDTEQLVLSPLSLFASPQRQSQAQRGDWDLVIIDEAHHIRWSEDSPSSEYEFVAGLARSTPGLLLLTATPEQLGEDSHFARLQLLDPDRFTDFQKFIQEQRDYRDVARIVDDLTSSGQEPSAQTLELIGKLIPEAVSLHTPADRAIIVKKLIDRHGPSRVLFRNTRANIKGFPERRLHQHPQTKPGEYDADTEQTTVAGFLYPETTKPKTWVRFDPRVGYLVEEYRRLKDEKILVICASADTVIDLERDLRTRCGIHSAVFHEDMSVVARDRAAHFFADRDGARLLLCSEIGSEGRNFQFAHHLVLFDLPLYPDLLEQRIGRLDRIGQSADVQIHVPYIEDSAQAVLFQWYHQGLNAFRKTCPVGQSVFDETEAGLLDALRGAGSPGELIRKTRSIYEASTRALEQGRDRLLEVSSFNRELARDVVESIKAAEAEPDVAEYLAQVFDAYGVEFEDKHQNTYIVRPGEHLHTPHFPYLKEDGMTVTFDRATALAHEDVEYLSWEHPMTQGAMELIASGDHGKAVAVGVDFDLLPRGSLLIETIHVLEIVAPNAPELRRFVATTMCQFIRDENGRNFSKLINSRKLFRNVRNVENAIVKKLLKLRRPKIVSIIEQNERDAKATFAGVIETARLKLISNTERELERLTYLQSVNASVRSEEIDLIREQLNESLQSFGRAQARLDAVRLIVTF